MILDGLMAGQSLLTLVKEHKANCKDESCTVSLFSLRNVYDQLTKQYGGITKEEEEYFI